MGVYWMKLNKMREQMAQAFINSLKEDKIPWHREWSVVGVKPFNGASDVRYRGINAMWLSYVSNYKGYDDPRWYTFKQAKEQGYKVKVGEKGTHIEFWSLYDTETKKKITQHDAKELSENLSPEEYFDRIKPISNTYVVFNAKQIEGVPETDIEKNQLNTEELISCRNKLVENMEVDFSEGGDRAFYSPAMDRITMPDIERFENEYAYMATFLHEAAHASGAGNRLNRDLTGTFGSEKYAKEELRAEIASAFTAQMTGISYGQNDYMENHKAYVQSWITILENNPNELFTAIKEAEGISDYLIEKGEFDNQINAIKEKHVVNEMEKQKDVVVTNAENNIDYFPDPNVSIDDMHKYGYEYDGMLPLSKERAIQLQNAFTIYRLYPDGTEAALENSDIQNDAGTYMYGVEKEDWVRNLDRMNDIDMVQDIAVIESVLRIPEAESLVDWYGDYHTYEPKLGVTSEQIKSRYEEYKGLIESYKNIEGVIIDNIAIDEDNYIHFTAKAGDYEYDGLYRIHDPQNGPDNKLVSIDYGYDDKVFEQQWENIEGFFKEYSIPKYQELQKHEINLFSGADAARLRMALKGNQTSKDTYFNSDKINENTKQLAFDVGTEAMEYISAGMDIKEVIAYKTKTIDEKLQINDLQYTKNILCSTFANTIHDYKEFMNSISLVDRDKMLLISEGLASKVIETGTHVYSIENGDLKQVTSRFDFENMNTKDYWIDREHFSNLPEEIKPVIKCEWSEHEAFDEEKVYTVSEFNSLMEREDGKFTEAKTKVLEKYGSWDNAYENSTAEDRQYLGYRKVKFEVDLGNGITKTERQDIGDGDGSVISFFKSYESGKGIAEELEKAVKKEEAFDEYINKLKAVNEYEQANNIPEDFRIITDDMSCLCRNMLDTQYELIASATSGTDLFAKNSLQIKKGEPMKKIHLEYGR